MMKNSYIHIFKHDQVISSPLAFVFLIVFGFSVAWYCLRVAGEIVGNTKDSAIVNINKRAGYVKK